MFIGEVVETGVIEPVVFPQILGDEPLPSTTETEVPIPEPVAAR
jgi:hypothetical protein